MAKYLAAVNLVGPNGETVLAEQPIPDDWDADYVRDLVTSRGAVEVEDHDTVDEALAE